MDILMQSAGHNEPYKSLYLRCVDTIRANTCGQQDPRIKVPKWALRYFAYDWVTLMNTAAIGELRGWDTMISYYTTDYDMYERMTMAGMSTNNADAGPVYDMSESLDDLAIL